MGSRGGASQDRLALSPRADRGKKPDCPPERIKPLLAGSEKGRLSGRRLY